MSHITSQRAQSHGLTQLRVKFSAQSFPTVASPFKPPRVPMLPSNLVAAAPVVVNNRKPPANDSKFRVLFSAVDNTHTTPPAVLKAIHDEFKPELDVCATKETAVCSQYLSPEVDGLAQKWSGICWMNPPYGKELPQWMEKAMVSAQQDGATVICLVPARTDTRWWHDFALKASEIRFIKGRLKFGHPNSKGHAAPFPSALVIFRPQ
jgi:phage N-6-adenine-methyltransferase